MAAIEKTKKDKKKEKVEKPSKKSKDKTGSKKDKKTTAAMKAFSLLADEQTTDPALSSLFAAKPTPPVRVVRTARTVVDAHAEYDDAAINVEQLQENDISVEEPIATQQLPSSKPASESRRKRKRKDEHDDLEDVYMNRLAREDAKETDSLSRERLAKRTRAPSVEEISEDVAEAVDSAPRGINEDKIEDQEINDDIDEDSDSAPPKHETEMAADSEVTKANRTVFLGNVSTDAITSKTSLKTLLNHLKSFFEELNWPSEGEPVYAVESIRFRSTAYASTVPKKAAYAKKDLMSATTKSTNAYVVYSSQVLAREAAKRLNGTTVLDRHLRVDEVAHPGKVDSRRCVFVGNLGFVDDETNIQKANEEDGREKRKPRKQPGDAEEGLWRAFAKCGDVESVRVIRDSKTRVGIGVAYVQFYDENAVESALLMDGKNFAPMLPRKLRVTRARAAKRNARPGSDRPTARTNTTGYQRKISGTEASQVGRAKKLYGRAGAAQMKRTSRSGGLSNPGKPSAGLVFEGHRASHGSGKAGLKLNGGKRSKKVGKPTSRSAKRGATFKASKQTKSS